MTTLAIIHDTFTHERIYAATPSRVFAAFASKEAKDVWADTGDLIDLGPEGGPAEFDFRVGGHERFGMGYQGVSYSYDACYHDIVENERLIYTYEMYADGARISVSVATVEFLPTEAGTRLTWTEQGAYLDGFDGAEAPMLRAGGTAAMLDGLREHLASSLAGR